MAITEGTVIVRGEVSNKNGAIRFAMFGSEVGVTSYFFVGPQRCGMS